MHPFPGINHGEVDKSRAPFVTYAKSQRYLSIKFLLSLSHFSSCRMRRKAFTPLSQASCEGKRTWCLDATLLGLHKERKRGRGKFHPLQAVWPHSWRILEMMSLKALALHHTCLELLQPASLGAEDQAQLLSNQRANAAASERNECSRLL